jgi:hypothetical protein
VKEESDSDELAKERMKVIITPILKAISCWVWARGIYCKPSFTCIRKFKRSHNTIHSFSSNIWLFLWLHYNIKSLCITLSLVECCCGE